MTDRSALVLTASDRTAAGTREDLLMKLTRRFAEMTPDNRPQDPHMDGTGLR